MSKRFLQNLLNETIGILENPANSKSGQGFRELQSDVKVHRISGSVNGVKNQVYAQLQEIGIPNRQINHPRMTEVIDKYVPNFVEAIYNNAKRRFDKKGEASNVRVRGNKSAWSVLILEGEYGYSVKRRELGHLSVFETIGNLYSSQKSTLVTNLNKVLREIATLRDGEYQINTRKFLDFGHRSGFAVVEQQGQRARDNFQGKIRQYNESSEEGPITDKDLKNLGLKIFWRKKGTLERDVIEVGIEAASINRGKKGEKELKGNLIQQLEDAIEKLDKSRSFAKRPGSDTRLEIESKKIIKRFDDKIERKKGVKVTTRDTKVKLSNSKVSKTKKPKTKKGMSKKAKLSSLGLKRATPTKGSAGSNISMIALINQKLPQTVRKNMGFPALVNRTGRFAESVQVTDITQTAKGFPSIGYTYRKNPYQIFEQGAGKPPWATTDRDPRKLIDTSIREIAAELLAGRFYTRRV